MTGHERSFPSRSLFSHHSHVAAPVPCDCHCFAHHHRCPPPPPALLVPPTTHPLWSPSLSQCLAEGGRRAVCGDFTKPSAAYPEVRTNARPHQSVSTVPSSVSCPHNSTRPHLLTCRLTFYATVMVLFG